MNLYGEKVLDLEGDDDQDGIKTKMNFMFTTKMVRIIQDITVIPCQQTVMGMVWQMGKTTIRKNGMSQIVILLFMELAYRDDDYIEKILDHKNPFLVSILTVKNTNSCTMNWLLSGR